MYVNESVWLSSNAMTVLVQTDDVGNIKNAPPIVKRFLGQNITNLIRWMNRQGGLKVKSLP